MKTKLIIATAAATVAGALLVKYFMKNKQAGRHIAEMQPVKRSHHLTDVFAHAKNHTD